MKPRDIKLTATYDVGDDLVNITLDTYEYSGVEVTFISSKVKTIDATSLVFESIDELRSILNNAETLFKTVISKSKKL